MYTNAKIDTYRKVLLVGGGTGGHFYPLIALAEEFNTHPERPELYYAGPDEYDAEALRNEGIHFMRISSGKQRRYASVLNFLDFFRVIFGFFTALIKLYILYPDVVVSKGGYTSVPVVLAAGFFRIPIIVHESDSVVGRANKLGLRFAKHVVTSYEGIVLPHTNAQQYLLGVPLRAVLRGGPHTDAIQKLGIDPNRPVILVLGGSQGALRINELILSSLDELLPDFTIIHQTGTAHYENCLRSADVLITNPELRAHYKPFAFFDGALLNDAYFVASLVISRAGSTSIYEISSHGKPSIIIPISEHISHDQRSNAYAYARYKASIVMEEKNLTEHLLLAEINRIMQNGDVYTEMTEGARAFAKPNATAEIVNLITQVSKQH